MSPHDAAALTELRHGRLGHGRRGDGAAGRGRRPPGRTAGVRRAAGWALVELGLRLALDRRSPLPRPA